MIDVPAARQGRAVDRERRFQARQRRQRGQNSLLSALISQRTA